MRNGEQPTRMMVTLKDRRGWRGWKRLVVVYAHSGEEAERVRQAYAILTGVEEGEEDDQNTKGDTIEP